MPKISQKKMIKDFNKKICKNIRFKERPRWYTKIILFYGYLLILWNWFWSKKGLTWDLLLFIRSLEIVGGCLLLFASNWKIFQNL